MTEYLPIADQINLLFEHILRPDNRPYTLKEVTESTGLNLASLSHMRTGKITNPQINTVRSLAEFFGVPLSYFATTSVDECFAIISQRENPDEAPREVTEISFRARHLSEKARHDLLTIIQWITSFEAAQLDSDGVNDVSPLGKYGL